MFRVWGFGGLGFRVKGCGFRVVTAQGCGGCGLLGWPLKPSETFS